MVGDEGPGEDLADKAVRAAAVARQVQKRAERLAREALTDAKREMKRKSKMVEKGRHDAAQKSTLQSYFMNSWHVGSGEPLMLVMDSKDFGIPGAKLGSKGEDSNLAAKTILSLRGGRFVSFDMTMTPSGSLSDLSNTVVLSSKSPIISLLESSKEQDNAGLAEVPNNLEGVSKKSPP